MRGAAVGIYKVKNPSGEIMYGIDFYDSSGQRVRQVIGDTKKLAEAALAKAKTVRFEEKVMGVKRQPQVYFSELREKFIEFSKANKKYKTYESHLNSLKFLNEAFDREFLSDITLLRIEEYKTQRLKLVSPASVNRELACLKYMLNKAEEWGLFSNNPSRKIQLMKESPGRIRYLSKEEIKKLVQSCGLEYLRVIVIIALNTGMRRGEILALKWSDIDFEQGIVHIEKTLSTKGERQDTKSGERRDLPMNNVLRKILMEWKDKSNGMELFAIKDIKRSFITACRKAGIQDFHFHDLRHTFASHQVMSGTDLTTVSKLLGHSTILMTMKYSHLSPDHMLKAMKRMEEFFED